ncbi:MAG: DUF2336 domain-containing protein [Alphaproteobacteria bacterium]|nr:DUF2336 domain-containing protein [Alphaproteobacteria bacterium]
MSDNVEVGLDISVLNTVLDTGDCEARKELALQLAALIADVETAPLERQQVTPILLKLSVDDDVDVRRALVGAVTQEGSLHSDIVFSIIADEDAIALPFLAQTPALNSWHMMAVLRVGDEARQAVVAARDDVTSEAANYIIKSSPVGTVRALMKNTIVQLNAQDCQILYQRFGQVAEIVEILLARPDLPLDIRIIQAKRVASRMRQLMAERGWVAANDATELVADAEENSILRVLVEAESNERISATRYLAQQNMLTPALVVRAAATGQMRVVETALAHLAGVSTPRAVDQMYSRSALGFKSIFKRSGLPMACFGIVKAACDVVADAKDEGLPLDTEEFGRRILEALMTRYEFMNANERTKQIEYVSRYASERVRKIAKRLKADMVRAA